VAGQATADYVLSAHQIDCRTKAGCGLQVLLLCVGHHHAGTGADPSLVAVHPHKARFEQLYGTQAELRAIANAMLEVDL
jgi:hypothetical protein